MAVFAFNTIKLKGADLRPVVVCVLLLLLFELVVGRGTLIWTVDQRSESGQLDVLESKVIAKAQAPSVVILGNSRTRDALTPIDLESAWGLERGGVLNLSMTGGEPFDYRVILERHRALIEQADVVFLAVEAWMFRDDPLITERFRRFADWDDRLAAWRATEDPGLLLGGLWRTYDARRKIVETPIEWLMQDSRQLRLTEDGRVTWREEDQEIGNRSINMDWELETYYRGYQPGRATVDDLIATARALHAAGVEVVIVRPPLRDEFVDARSDLALGAQRNFESVMADLKQQMPWLRFVVNQRASELGLDWRSYVDYGHMSLFGGRLYSSWLAEQVPLSADPLDEAQ